MELIIIIIPRILFLLAIKFFLNGQTEFLTHKTFSGPSQVGRKDTIREIGEDYDIAYQPQCKFSRAPILRAGKFFDTCQKCQTCREEVFFAWV